MTTDEPGSAPRPFSWDQVAAELAAAEAADEAATDLAWDDVAARLAASLSTPTTAPARHPVPAPSPDLPAGSAPDVPHTPDPAGDPVAPDPAAPDRAAPDVVPDTPPGDGRPLGSLDETPVEEAAPAVRTPDADPAADPWELRGGLEALLFVVDSPVDEDTLAGTLRCTVEQLRDTLAALGADYDARGAGVSLRRVGEGWRLYTREEHAAVVERYLLDGPSSRLTQAALETLAVIAYRQPVTRARVSAIRGVGVDAVVRTLASRGLVYECGTDPDSGGGLYATTPLFLERLGLTGLDELPELGPLLPEARTLLDERRAARDPADPDLARRDTDF